jgi:hypothetical protein
VTARAQLAAYFSSKKTATSSLVPMFLAECSSVSRHIVSPAG